MTLALAGLAVAAALQTAPAQSFQPIEGQPYRYVTRQLRTDGGVKRSFTTERRVAFHRLGGGWRAEIILERTDQPAQGDVGTMFQAAMGALIGRPVRLDLDTNGAVLAVDDIAALWRIVMDAIDAMGHAAASARGTDTRQITARMRALPVPRQSAFIASMITSLIDPAAARRTPGKRPVDLASVSPLGTPLTLHGEEEVTLEADGIVAISTNASGSVPPLIAPGLPGADIAPPAATAPATVNITTLRRVDAATGLIVSSRDENEACTIIDGRRSCLSTLTEVSLTAVVS